MIALGAVRDHTDVRPALHDAVAIDGSYRERVVAGARLPLEPPLHPAVDRRFATECGGLPVAVVDPDLDRCDAAVLCPADSTDRDGAGADPVAAARHVDPRRRLDRCLRGPASIGPVRGELRELGHLEVHQPLGG